MVRKPTQQIEHMEQANVRPGYEARRPESDLEVEEQDMKQGKQKLKQKGT